MTEKDKAQYIAVLLALAGFGHLNNEENELSTNLSTEEKKVRNNAGLSALD